MPTNPYTPEQIKAAEHAHVVGFINHAQTDLGWSPAFAKKACVWYLKKQAYVRKVIDEAIKPSILGT